MNRLYFKIVLIVVTLAAFFIPAFAQGLIVTAISVDDSVNDISCHPNFGTQHIKGNDDGAISPGERVRLDVTVRNQTGYDITYMYAVMFEYSPYLNAISPNCYLGVPHGGEIGVRYVELGTLANGATASNFDPFVLEVSQDVPCNQSIELGVTFFYTTAGGGCAASCAEVHNFSLPVFSLNKPVVSKPEQELFQSSNGHKLLLHGDQRPEPRSFL